MDELSTVALVSGLGNGVTGLENGVTGHGNESDGCGADEVKSIDEENEQRGIEASVNEVIKKQLSNVNSSGEKTSSVAETTTGAADAAHTTTGAADAAHTNREMSRNNNTNEGLSEISFCMKRKTSVSTNSPEDLSFCTKRKTRSTNAPEDVSAMSSAICSFSSCEKEEEDFMLKCSKCERSAHYSCTQFSSYQLLITPDYRQYICHMCTLQLSRDILVDYFGVRGEYEKNQISSDMTEGDTKEEPNEKVKSLQREIRVKGKELDCCLEHITKVKNENGELKQKLKDFDEMQKESARNVRKVRSLEAHQEVLRQHIKDLNQRIEIREAMDEQGLNMDSETENGELLAKISSDLNNQLHSFEEKMGDKFNTLSVQVSDAVSEQLDQKLTDLDCKFVAAPNVPEEITTDTCTTVTELDYQEMIDDQPNDIQGFKVDYQEMIDRYHWKSNQDMDILRRRQNNIIVFNAKESTATIASERKSDDISLFISICNSLCENVITEEDIIQARRLGQYCENGVNRPLLVTISSIEIKKKVFTHLYKLKQTDQFLNVTMSHDLTVNERIKTRMLVEQAKKKTKKLMDGGSSNEGGQGWVFKVRGPPWGQRIQKVRRPPHS